MHLTYVSFSYLSKVNLGGRLCIGRRHLVKTLVVVMSQCITPTFSPYFCLAHIFNRPVQSDEENAKIQGTYAQFFLSVGLSCFFLGGGGVGGLTRGSWSKVLFGYFFLIVPSPTPKLCWRRISWWTTHKYSKLHLTTPLTTHTRLSM